MQWAFAILSSEVCMALILFPLCLINGTIFWKKKKVIENKMFVWFSLQLLSESFLILRRIKQGIVNACRFQWPRGLRRRSAAARLLRSWVRIRPGAWVFICCKCCVLSGRGLCDELITRPEESYRLWCVVVCDLENLKNEEAMTRVGSQRHKKN